MFSRLGETAEAKVALVQRNGEEGTHARDLKGEVVTIL